MDDAVIRKIDLGCFEIALGRAQMISIELKCQVRLMKNVEVATRLQSDGETHVYQVAQSSAIDGR